jgi:phage terminase large subunit GpA-like protein
MPLDLSNEDGLRSTIARARRYVIPPPELLPSEWAEAHVRIPQSNALPGPMRFRNAPYQREPLDMIANPDVDTISLMWGAQTGKTQIQLMALGYYIAHKPASQILMQPTETDLSTWLANKFDAMVATTPAIKRQMAPPRGREGVNNQRLKQYIGGSLMFAWSGSASTMRGRSAPKIYCDEIDGYERTQEGSPVALLSERNSTFGDDRLLFLTSTPTLKHFSAIETYYLSGDCRRWWVPCPSCGEYQILEWDRVRWDKDGDGRHLPETAHYACAHCDARWDDSARYRATRSGEWRAEKPFDGHASYHLPSMASLFVKLETLAREFLFRKKNNDLQTFVNTKLAETWDEPGEQLDHTRLMSRAEVYPAEVPPGVLVLTAGADVQQDRIEFEVVGWGSGEENWSIDYQVLIGDPTQDAVWDELLDLWRHMTWSRADGSQMRIDALAVDSGFLPKRVYRFVGQSK